MSFPKRICVITGSRAEYGLLRPLMKGIRDDPDLSLQIIATGSHLSPDFGSTYRDIEGDGFQIDSKVEILTKSDSAVGVLNSMALGLIGISRALDELKPDLLLVLGDRYEILVAAQVAMIMQIPLAHLAGGDIGSGTYDNTIRHCITKIAALHFVTHNDARRRVIQLGERADRVFCFGATCVENVINTPLLSREELERNLGINLEKDIFLVTFHPLTMDENSGEDQLQELLKALEYYRTSRSVSIIFTKANADNGGRPLNEILEKYVQCSRNCHLFDSLGQQRYLSMMKHAAVVIGNSSSGIYEAPYFNTPTVDIGTRQRGRAAPDSVIRCEPDEASIEKALDRALRFEFNGIHMLYGEGKTSVKILAKIKELIDLPNLAAKEFIDFGEDR